jgi:hypothetical protein
VTTKTMQQKFEEAFLRGRDPKNPMVSCLITKYVGQDNYSNPGTQAMFEMFQKGAGSVVVELPKAWSTCGGDVRHEEDGDWFDVDDVRAAITAAGGSVAP